MKRVLFVMVVGLGMGMMGCAEGVEDPVEPAPAPEEQRDPPRQALNVKLRDPQAQLISAIELDNGYENVRPKQMPVPGPLPTPEP